jgi:nitrate reductase NapE component
MSSIVEMLSGILRLFPNTMMITLLVVGLATNRIPWIFVALGGFITGLVVYMFQMIAGKLPGGDNSIPGFDVVEACSIIPQSSSSDKYIYTPSLWVALTTFFLAYILTNAVNIYTAPAGHGSKHEATTVLQRKGIGLISIFAAVSLFVFLVGARWYTTCESTMGLITGVLIGASIAYGWWHVLSACGADVYPDMHGVLIGLGPASLQTDRQVICTR